MRQPILGAGAVVLVAFFLFSFLAPGPRGIPGPVDGARGRSKVATAPAPRLEPGPDRLAQTRDRASGDEAPELLLVGTFAASDPAGGSAVFAAPSGDTFTLRVGDTLPQRLSTLVGVAADHALIDTGAGLERLELTANFEREAAPAPAEPPPPLWRQETFVNAVDDYEEGRLGSDGS